LRIKPDDAEAHNNLGALFAQTGRVAEAKEHYEEALRLDPDDAEAHNNLGALLAQTGRVAEAVERMGLRYAVVTSVNRDDQKDGGAAIFARTIQEIRQRVPDCKVEVLIPDFRGDWAALGTVMEARPDVLNHNMETVPRLYRRVRKGAVYERSLELLRRAREMAPGVPTKTGMMLGLGESREEVLEAMEDIAAQGTHILTLGQYMQPTLEHLPIERYVHPDEFAELKRLGEQMGLKHVEAGPLVRSSYHAFEQEEAARSQASDLPVSGPSNTCQQDVRGSNP